MDSENWSIEELKHLARHSNQTAAELTERDIEEVRARRLQRNFEINCWDTFDPERTHEAD